MAGEAGGVEQAEARIGLPDQRVAVGRHLHSPAHGVDVEVGQGGGEGAQGTSHGPRQSLLTSRSIRGLIRVGPAEEQATVIGAWK